MMTVDEVKQLLEITTDQELSTRAHRRPSAVSNWRKAGEVPATVLVALGVLESGGKGKVELSTEDQENLDLYRKLSPKKKRELKAEMYRLLAEQEREALKEK